MEDRLSLQTSNYAYGVKESEKAASQYAFDYQEPHRDRRADLYMPSAHHSHYPFPREHHYVLPDSAYDYTAYGQPVRYTPTHSDYDYTAFAQPYMQPPYFYPP
ncbi:hypothetical protein OSTOST_08148 [Ostertagia ostertagi]